MTGNSSDADGLLGPAAPFKVHQSLIPLQRLYAAGTEENTEGQAANGPTPGVNEGQAMQKSKDMIVEDAVTREWHRIRLHRMGLAV